MADRVTPRTVQQRREATPQLVIPLCAGESAALIAQQVEELTAVLEGLRLSLRGIAQAPATDESGEDAPDFFALHDLARRAAQLHARVAVELLNGVRGRVTAGARGV